MSDQKNIFFCSYWGKTTSLLSLPLYRRSNEFCKCKWAFYFLKHVLEIDVFISTEEIDKFIHVNIFWNFKFWLICIHLAIHAQHFDILMTAWASITACPQHKAQSRGHFTYKCVLIICFLLSFTFHMHRAQNIPSANVLWAKFFIYFFHKHFRFLAWADAFSTRRSSLQNHGEGVNWSEGVFVHVSQNEGCMVLWRTLDALPLGFTSEMLQKLQLFCDLKRERVRVLYLIFFGWGGIWWNR